MKVLVVDDEPLARHVLRRALDRLRRTCLLTEEPGRERQVAALDQ